MKKLFFVSLCVAFFAGAARTEKYKYGPYSNYEGYEEDSFGVEIPTTREIELIIPYYGEYCIKSYGGGIYWIKYPAPVFSASYLEFETAEEDPFDPVSDAVKLIEVWAKNAEPNHDPNEIPELTGFDPCDPEIAPLSGGEQTGGWVRGYSGTIYYADVCQVTVGNLGDVIPDYNISQFTGDSNLIVYVQQVTVPANDVTPFVFTFDYQGYVEDGDPCWIEPNDPNFTYLHSWDMNIIQWNPAVAQVTDVDVQAPHIYPGVIEISEPEGWGEEGTYVLTLGRAGWETNPGEPITETGPILGFRLFAMTPSVEAGIVVLTDNNEVVGGPIYTVVPGREELCGDVGYTAGDINRDCKVDLTDLAYLAQGWLECTDPCGPGCINANIVGVGFAFNGNDTQGPARILYLYDDYNADVLEPNDIILEYRDTEVSNGKELLETILGMEDVNAGESVSMLIKRDDVEEQVVAIAKSTANSYLMEAVPLAKCVYWSNVETGEDNCTCAADPQTDWCEQGLDLLPYAIGSLDNKVATISTWCRDSNNNSYSTPGVGPAPDVRRILIIGK